MEFDALCTIRLDVPPTIDWVVNIFELVHTGGGGGGLAYERGGDARRLS